MSHWVDSGLLAKYYLESVSKSGADRQPEVQGQDKATALHYWQGVPSADSVELLLSLFYDGLEGVNPARRVLSNKFSAKNNQSSELSCTVDIQWQSFSTQ
jgi:hypothetical protein